MDGTTIVTTLNLHKVCRACLNECEEMLSIFSEIQSEGNVEDEPMFLCEMLSSISTIKIAADDGLPTLICTPCVEMVHTSFKFQQQCNRSQEILNVYALQLQSKEYEVNENVLEYINSTITSTNKEDDDDLFQETLVEESRCIELEHDLLDEKESIEETLDLTDNDVIMVCKEDESNVIVKTEVKDIKDEPVVEVVEEVIKPKRVKRSDGESKRNGQPAVGFSYYVKMNENGEKVFECNYCKKFYKHSQSVKIHIRTHTLERPYVCSQCGKGFKQHSALTYHLHSHTGEQPYACKICGKRYRQSGTLTAHMRIHTGQRPFLCSVCGRGFRQAPDLGYHMRTHTKERPYMCNICGKTMRMQCHLVQHMRIHTGEKPFHCTECNKAFPSSTRLKRHAIIHTGLKPFTCEVCNKSFNRSSSLRVHAKIHTDERPHICTICSKGFIQAHALRGHMNTHITEDNVCKTEEHHG